MHRVGIENTIRFVLPINGSPPAQSTYDVQVQKPDGTVYTDSNLTAYVAPTATAQGSATYVFTPDMVGRWVMIMSSGAAAANVVDSAVEIFVLSAAGVTSLNRRIAVSALIPQLPPLITGSASVGPDGFSVIRAFGWDGDNRVIISGRDLINGSNSRGLWVSDVNMETYTYLMNWNSLPSWSGSTSTHWISQITYIPKYSRWVISTHNGQVWYCDDPDLLVWNYVATFSGWSATASDVMFMRWNPQLELIYIASRDGGARKMMVSADGITWYSQESVQSLGGTWPEFIWNMTNVVHNGEQLNIIWQWEEYIWKTGASTDSTGWTKTPNNGVIGGSGGLWAIHNIAVSPDVVAVGVNAKIAVNADPTIHGNWLEYDAETDMGGPSTFKNIVLFMYHPSFTNPWILFDEDTGWWEINEITVGVAPQLIQCVGEEPWASLQAAFVANGIGPTLDPNNTDLAQYYYPQSVLSQEYGIDGYYITINNYGNISTPDYVLLQRPTPV